MRDAQVWLPEAVFGKCPTKMFLGQIQIERRNFAWLERYANNDDSIMLTSIYTSYLSAKVNRPSNISDLSAPSMCCNCLRTYVNNASICFASTFCDPNRFLDDGRTYQKSSSLRRVKANLYYLHKAPANITSPQ